MPVKTSLRQGDRVKLTAEGVRVYLGGKPAQKTITRHGTIYNDPNRKQTVSLAVLWDGTRVPGKDHYYDPEFLECVEVREKSDA